MTKHIKLYVFLLLITSNTDSTDSAEGFDECKESIDLIGTGASAAASKMDALGNAYARARNAQGRNVNYAFFSMTSRYALDQLMKNRTIDGKALLFAITTIRLTEKEQREYPHVRMFPIMAWPMVICFNVPGVRKLVVKVDMLSRVYMGKIKYWDDPVLQALNPGEKLPHKRIIPVASAGDSGDARIITEAFSSIDPEWKEKYGEFTDPKFVTGYCCNSTSWPSDVVKYFGKRSLGMMGIVASIPYTIGYLASSLSEDLDISYALLENSMGARVEPNSDGVRAAVESQKSGGADNLQFSLSNALNPKAYPLVSFTYMLFNVSTTPGITCCQMQELVGLVEWILSQSAQFFEDSGAISVTDHVADTVLRVILRETRCLGHNTYDQYKKSTEKAYLIESWAVMVIAAVFAAILFGASLTAYIVFKGKYDRGNIRWIILASEIRKGFGSSSSASLGTSVSSTSLAGFRATYDGQAVLMAEVNVEPPTQWRKSTRKEFTRLLKLINHRTAVRIIGVTYMDTKTMVIYECPGKGTLRQTLRKTKFDIHDDFKMALSMNLLNGLSYLHSKGIIHGLLNSETCYVDSNWELQIGQWIDLMLYNRENPHAMSELFSTDIDTLTDEDTLRLYFLDPRALTGVFDKANDIFSLGLLIFEIFTFTKEITIRTPEMIEILRNKLNKGTSELPSTREEVPRSIQFLVRMCLGEPDSRPTIDVMHSEVAKLRTSKKNIVDMLMETMENYSAKLAETVEERTTALVSKTSQLEAMTRKMEDLLHEVLPPEIASKLLAGIPIEPTSFEMVSIYFSDVVGFTKISSQSTPRQVMTFLNDLWSMFDDILIKYDCYKVDTIGDAYLVCSGLPQLNGMNHAREIAVLGLEVVRACQLFRIKHMPDKKLEVRIGMNCGPVTTGVIGSKMPQYCVFGDAVIMANMLEATSEHMKIQTSRAFRDLLEHNFPEFVLRSRGMVEIPGKGKSETYWLEGRRVL